MNCYFSTFLISLLLMLSKGKCCGTNTHNPVGVSELDYKLGDGQSFFKRITDSDLVLIVGSPPEISFGRGDTYICKKLTEKENIEYNEVRETFVKIKQNTKESDTVAARNEVNEYFIYDSMEIWECKMTNKKKQTESFLRVYNTLISIKEIGGVEYYDTVEVSSVNYNGDKASVKIAELKYIKKIDNTYFTVEYEGLLDLRQRRLPKASYPNEILKLYPRSKQPTTDENKQIKSLRSRLKLPDSFKVIETHFSGKTLFIDAPEKFVNFYGNGTCLKLQGMDNPFPNHFKPQIYEYDSYNNRVKIGEKDFSKYFVIIKRVVWMCFGALEGFYQIQNEVMITAEVSELILNDQIEVEHVHSIRLTQGTGIRFKETRQFEISSGRPVEFHGVMEYESEHEFSSTFYHIPNEMDIFFRLSPKAVYRTFISSEGYDLRIGSRYERSITDIPLVKCNEIGSYDTWNISEDLLSAQVKFKINKKDMIHAMERVNNKGQYFETTSKQVWECHKSTKLTQFLRVVNKLKILVPVRYLETFDGVEILYVDLPGNEGKSVNIVETKYLDFDNPSIVVSYGGKLRFHRNSRASIARTKAEVITAVQKTTEETVPFIGSNYDFRSLQMGDHDPIIYASKPPSQTFVYSKGISVDKIFSMEFNASISDSLVNVNGVTECKFLPGSKQLPPVVINLINKKTGEITNEINLGMDDSVEHSKYFETKVSEVWECKIPKRAEPILRIVNRQELKEDPILSTINRQGIEDPNTLTLTYNPNVDTVWVESENNKYVIKMEDIRYLNQTSQQLIYLNAVISLGEKREPGDWMSGTRCTNYIYNSKDPTTLSQNFRDALITAGKNWQKPIIDEDSDNMNKLGKITYTGKFHTMTFRKGYRKFQIGSLWETELPVEDTPMYCEIAPSHIFGNHVYIPRVMEYIDGKMHLLDEETLKDAFNIPVRKVWFCSNGEDKIIRIFTALCAKEPFRAVRHHDGIKVTSFQIHRDARSAEVTETIYIDVSTYDILKYEGTPLTTSNPESGAPFCPPVFDEPPPRSSRFSRSVKSLFRRFGIGNK